ncbi:MAG: family 10 glycosylhydrolase [Myxococcota bacterium]
MAAPREFRGLWVATVANLDFPSHKGLSPDDARAELAALVAAAADAGFNALVFQVRPESDALYASSLEPWSRYLTGHQGGDPGFDPLAALIEEAHAHAIEVHAWFNPYRASAVAGAPCADTHVTKQLGGAVCPWGRVTWLDPGSPDVQQHTLDVIGDVVTRYDVDGVHLDDYFYPYPDGGRAFPDQASYRAYTAAGGDLDRDAWRRHNVDDLVRRISEAVAAARPGCRFGISPFGIYRPGQPAGIRGMDQVVALHADPMAWYDQGWVDYLAPQLYWSTKRQAQRYDLLLDWWNEHMQPERPLLVGLDVTRVGKEAEWSLDELRQQVTLSRGADRTAGQIWFRATPVLKNQGGIADLAAELYAEPALPPAKPGFAVAPALPDLAVEAGAIAIAAPEAPVRAYVLYGGAEATPAAERILPPGTAQIEVEPGTWAVSAVGPGGVESEAVRVVVGG